MVAAVLGASCGSSWGLDAITTLATPADAPLECGVTLPADTLAPTRDACGFHAGAHPEETLGVSPETAARFPIRHLVVLMRENRSFDHLLGQLHDQGQPLAEPIPDGFQNLDLVGAAVNPFHPTTTCLGGDPDHQWGGMHLGVNGGAMNGFVASAAYSTDSDGHFVMGVYDDTDLPFYYWLAKTFALGTRHFAPLDTGTYPNRYLTLFGSNLGFQSTTAATYPAPGTPSIFGALLDAGATWGVYSDGSPLSGCLDWRASDPGVHRLQDFFDALDQGTLPNVAFVDGIENLDDDHPTADLQRGEAWLHAIYLHAAQSPQWPRLAMIWTYDEGGGFADHVPPPSACAPSTAKADRFFTERGPRVPLVVISPWAKRGYVSDVVRDHIVDHPVDRAALRSPRAHRARREQRRPARHVRLLLRERSHRAAGPRRGHPRVQGAPLKRGAALAALLIGSAAAAGGWKASPGPLWLGTGYELESLGEMTRASVTRTSGLRIHGRFEGLQIERNWFRLEVLRSSLSIDPDPSLSGIGLQQAPDASTLQASVRKATGTPLLGVLRPGWGPIGIELRLGRLDYDREKGLWDWQVFDARLTGATTVQLPHGLRFAVFLGAGASLGGIELSGLSALEQALQLGHHSNESVTIDPKAFGRLELRGGRWAAGWRGAWEHRFDLTGNRPTYQGRRIDAQSNQAHADLFGEYELWRAAGAEGDDGRRLTAVLETGIEYDDLTVIRILFGTSDAFVAIQTLLGVRGNF